MLATSLKIMLNGMTKQGVESYMIMNQEGAMSLPYKKGRSFLLWINHQMVGGKARFSLFILYMIQCKSTIVKLEDDTNKKGWFPS